MSTQKQLPPLKVYALPISGGALVAQLAFLIEMFNARTKIDPDPINRYPNLVLGSSGGNISAYIGMAGGWSEAGIIRMARMMESEMFIMSWWPPSLDFMPTSVIGIFNSSLYRRGYGVKTLFKNFLAPKRAQQIEIWTGTFNKTKMRAQFFCNKKEGTTYINEDRFEKDRVIYDCEPLTFTNGDLDLLAEITIASASIPVLVPNQPIRGNEYADGGTAYSSPLSVFSTELLRIVTGDSNINTVTETLDFVEEYEDDLIVSKGDNNAGNSASSLKPVNSSRHNNVQLKPNTIKGIRGRNTEYTPMIPQISPCIKGDIPQEISIENILTAPPIQKYSLQLVYFSCYDLYTTTNQTSNNGITGEAGMTINSMIGSLEVLDRGKGIELMKTFSR